jgi:hypothetical protein
VYELVPSGHDSIMALSTDHAWQHHRLFVAEEHSAHDVQRPTVYLDTSIPSYLTAPLSRNVITARRQLLTRWWWVRRRTDFDLCISERVLEEARSGRPAAAAMRLNAMHGIRAFGRTPAMQDLARKLIGGGRLPEKASADAEHVAIAAMNSVHFLLTWNCKHLANSNIKRAVARTCEAEGFRCPEICTPEQLMRIYAHARSTS